MKLIDTLSHTLAFPSAYRAFRNLVAKQNLWRTYLDEYVMPRAGERVLDIGCGPADILDHLPKVDYTGLDLSPDYIEAAKKRFGSRGRFLCGDIGTSSLQAEQGTFDLVLATGVLHHLTDEQVESLFALARGTLRPGGRLVTYDGCYVPGQSRMARWILSNDRGKFVRTRPQYERLALAMFSALESYLRQDLLRIPYTHLIMRCSN